MNTSVLIAAGVGLCLIVVLLIGTRRPRTIRTELDRPQTETVTRPTDQVLADVDSFATAVASPRSPESVDWPGLLNHMQQLTDAALATRSGKVKEILGATQPTRASFIQAIDRIAQTGIMFVDPARLTTLAGQLRQILDQATVIDPGAHLPVTETMTRPVLPESVDWPGLLDQMQQLADAALGSRSTKVKAMLGAAQPSRASFTWVIDRIANTSVMFVDPARLDSLASEMRRILDEATS